MLVLDVTDDFLNQILDGHKTVCPAVFIDDDGKMGARGLDLRQHVAQRLRRRNEQDFPQDRLQREIVAPVPILQHVADMDHAGHIVERLAIDDEAGMAGFEESLDQLVEADGGRHRIDIGARHHDVIDRHFAEFEEVADHLPLALIWRVEGGLGMFVDDAFEAFPQGLLPLATGEPPQPGEPGIHLARGAGIAAVTHHATSAAGRGSSIGS